MSNKLHYIAFVIIALASSCSKTSNSQLVGSWVQTEWAADDNGNGVLDATETRPQGNPIARNKLVFKSNNRAEAGSDVIEDVRWKLKDDGKRLEIKYTSGTVAYKILVLNDKELLLEREGEKAMWQTFARQ